MKAIKLLTTLFVCAFLLQLIAAGQQNPQLQTQTSTTLPTPLEQDPRYAQLSPQGQSWMRANFSRFQAAIEHEDLKALRLLTLEAAQFALASNATKFCGEHVMNQGTFVDAFVSNGTNRAFAVRWLEREPGTTVRTAIFTDAGRCIIADGSAATDGKVILRALPNSLAITKSGGYVVWEGEYWNTPVERLGGGAPHRGAFIEGQWVADLDPHTASVPFSLALRDGDADFRWNDETNALEFKPGVVVVPAPAGVKAPLTGQTNPSKQPPAAQAGCGAAKPPAKRAGFGGLSLPGPLGKVLEKVPLPCPAAPASGQGGKQ